MPVDPTIDDTEQATLLDECVRFADELAADDTVLSGEAATHVSQCLRCQAEIANYKRMRRVMRGLADHDDVEVSDLEHRILVAVDAADGTPSSPASSSANRAHWSSRLTCSGSSIVGSTGMDRCSGRVLPGKGKHLLAKATASTVQADFGGTDGDAEFVGDRVV